MILNLKILTILYVAKLMNLLTTPRLQQLTQRKTRTRKTQTITLDYAIVDEIAVNERILAVFVTFVAFSAQS